MGGILPEALLLGTVIYEDSMPGLQIMLNGTTRSILMKLSIGFLPASVWSVFEYAKKMILPTGKIL